MSKYKILMYPGNKHDTRLDNDEYETVDEAVRNAMEYGTSDFAIIKIIEWQVVTEAEEV